MKKNKLKYNIYIFFNFILNSLTKFSELVLLFLLVLIAILGILTLLFIDLLRKLYTINYKLFNKEGNIDVSITNEGWKED